MDAMLAGMQLREARLKQGQGAVLREKGIGQMERGILELEVSLFCPFCPLPLPPPPSPTSSRRGGAEVWVRIDYCIPPLPHSPTFHLPGWTAELLLGNNLCFVLMCPRNQNRVCVFCIRSLNLHWKEGGGGGAGDYLCALM